MVAISPEQRAFQEYAEADPEGAARLIKKLRPKVKQPHPGQLEVIEADSRYKVLNCGRRWGKTVVGANVLVRQARTLPAESVLWWVAPTYKVVKRGYREVLRQLPRELLTHEPPPDTNFDAGRSVILKFKNGTQIEFYSAERPEGMLGEGVGYAVLDEAATMPSRIWEQIVRPTLMDKQGGAMLISTPRGRNWFYKRWLMGQDDGRPQWSSWTFTSYDNPYVEDSEVKEMEEELPLVLFEQEALAKFIASGSSVFQWDENHVQYDPLLDNGMVEGVDPRGHVFLGIDLAKTTDFTVLMGAREYDRRNIYFERFHDVRWSEQKRRIRRAAGKLMRAGATGVTLIVDSTGVGDPIVEDLEDQGFDVVGINFSSTKTKMVMSLAKDLETGKAFLLGDGQIVEFENYMMATTKTGKITYSAPEGEHDDAVSAKMLSHWGMTTEGAPSVTVVSASDAADPSNPNDAFDDDDGNDWSDLLDDEDYEDDPTAGMEEDSAAATMQRLLRPPTPEELLRNPDAWH